LGRAARGPALQCAGIHLFCPFATSATANPALTLSALTLRTAEVI
jgi:hypothetical protein